MSDLSNLRGMGRPVVFNPPPEYFDLDLQVVLPLLSTGATLVMTSKKVTHVGVTRDPEFEPENAFLTPQEKLDIITKMDERPHPFIPECVDHCGGVDDTAPKL